MDFLKHEVDNYNDLLDNLSIGNNENYIGNQIEKVKKEINYKTDKEIYSLTSKTREQVISCLYTLQYI